MTRPYNYKTCKDLTGTLQELCPNGIDIDNVGGKVQSAYHHALGMTHLSARMLQ